MLMVEFWLVVCRYFVLLEVYRSICICYLVTFEILSICIVNFFDRTKNCNSIKYCKRENMDRPDITMETREKIKANLKKYDFEYTSLHVPALQKASVLIPLFVKKGELHTLMTLRSVKLKTGAGEVCFPGGKHDSQDRDEIDTALREAEEEIGLLPHEVDVVGRLFPVMTKGGILVTPVVAFIEDTFQAHPSPEEVSSVFSVPLRHFLSSTQHSSCHIPGVNIKLHNFSYLDPDSQKEYHIWGLTAVLAILIAVLALKKKPEFEVDFDTEDPVSHFRHTLHLQISKL